MKLQNVSRISPKIHVHKIYILLPHSHYDPAIDIGTKVCFAIASVYEHGIVAPGISIAVGKCLMFIHRDQ